MFDEATAWLATSLLACVFLTGLIWTVQLVHYPLFERVGRFSFERYHREHVRRMGWIAAPVMLLELFSAAGLYWQTPAGVSEGFVELSLYLLAIIWVSTFAVQVPFHARLERGFTETYHRALVGTNWVRTAAWSARSLLLLTMFAQLLGDQGPERAAHPEPATTQLMHQVLDLHLLHTDDCAMPIAPETGPTELQVTSSPTLFVPSRGEDQWTL